MLHTHIHIHIHTYTHTLLYSFISHSFIISYSFFFCNLFYIGFKELPDAHERIKAAEYRKTQTKAVLVIQSAWRGLLARGGVRELRRLAKVAWVVPKMQGLIRGHITRVKIANYNRHQLHMRIANIIQRIYRGYKGRLYTNHLKRLKLIRENKEYACSTIQRAYRGHRGRKVYRKLKKIKEEHELEILRLEMIVLVQCKAIQSWWRVQLAKTLFKRLLAEDAERKRIAAEGEAAANKIVNISLTPSLLKMRGIEATIELSKSNNSKVVIIGSGDDGMPLILNQ